MTPQVRMELKQYWEEQIDRYLFLLSILEIKEIPSLREELTTIVFEQRLIESMLNNTIKS